ncbi:MAG: hypothetical protein ABI560_07215, partial [Myxococcales bacterium]
MNKLTALSKMIIVTFVVASAIAATYTRREWLAAQLRPLPGAPVAAAGPGPGTSNGTIPTTAPLPGRKTVTVALSQWPGHLA